MENIKIEPKNYNSIVEEFTLPKIQTRYERLLTLSNEFIEKMGYEKKVQLNQLMLGYIVMDYFSDISRIKKFHSIEFVNKIKVVSYEVSWILKRKPFQVTENNKQLLDVNEHFALFLILTFLSETENVRIDFNEHIKYFWDTLFYYFKFREINPQTIELALTAFCAGRDLNKK